MKFILNYGKSQINSEVSTENILSILKPKRLPELKNEEDNIFRAIRNPMGTKPLNETLERGMKISLIVSDITRPCPSHKILVPLVTELNNQGVRDVDIEVVFATGIHRKHTPIEQAMLIGEGMIGRLKVKDHDPFKKERLEYVGKTKRGTEVSINKSVFESDFIIGVANIDMHYFAGYSGGSKSLLPGVSAYETIQQNHNLMMMTGSEPGKADGNPVREDSEEGARKANLNFILNVVLNDEKHIVEIVAGDLVKAHRKGAEICDYMYKTHIDEKADIVIASAGGFPKDIDLYQAQKGLDNASYAVKKGGTIIFLAECQGGFGENTFKSWLLEAHTPEEVIEMQKRGFVLGGHKAFSIARIASNVEILLVSSMSKSLPSRGLIKPVKTIQEGLEEAFAKHGKDATVVVMPYAGSTLPTFK